MRHITCLLIYYQDRCTVKGATAALVLVYTCTCLQKHSFVWQHFSVTFSLWMPFFPLRCCPRIHAGRVPNPSERVRWSLPEAGVGCFQAERHRWHRENGLEPRFLWQRSLGEHPQVSYFVSDGWWWLRLVNVEPCLNAMEMNEHHASLVSSKCVNVNIVIQQLLDNHKSRRNVHCNG